MIDASLRCYRVAPSPECLASTGRRTCLIHKIGKIVTLNFFLDFCE
jgi:hypothetical protein